MRVCFTGKGMQDGKLVTRDVWERMAIGRGYSIAANPNQGFDLLVASRHDTSKAVNARARGVRVVSYDDFLAMVGDIAPAAAPPPAKPFKIDATELESNPLWGTF